MSLRQIFKFLIPKTPLYSNASLAARWKQIPYSHQRYRTVHISSGYNNKHFTQPNDDPELHVCRGVKDENPVEIVNIVNRVIPPHELTNPRTLTMEDWRSESDTYKDAKVFRGVLKVLGQRQLYDAGQSYIEMIKQHESQLLTPFNEIHILKFFLDCTQPFEPFSNEKLIQYVVSTFHKVRKAFPLLENYSSEVLLLAMQKTPKWRDAIELLDDLSFISKPKSIVFSAIIINAFKENDAELGWSLIDKMKEYYRCPHDECWIEWLQYCVRNGPMEWKDSADRMLRDFHGHHFHMSCRVATELSKYIDKYCPEHSVEVTSIRHSHCVNCQTDLRTPFNSADHAVLKELVDAILNHDSVYASSTPEEINKFLKFMRNCDPYGIVIDGMNAVYRIRSSMTEDLRSIQRHFNAPLLVFGRKHLLKNKSFRELSSFCQVFLCDNMSRDDIFFLKAAVYHSANVKFLTDDKLRPQFHYLAEDNRRNLFLRWQYMNQLEHKGNQLFYSPTYLPEAHRTDDGDYHIPCVDQSSTNLIWTPANPKYWLCIRPKSKADEKKSEADASESETSHPDRWSTSRWAVYQQEPSSQVSTVIDELVESLKSKDSPAVKSKNVPIDPPMEEPVKKLLLSFRAKYRRQARDVVQPESPPESPPEQTTLMDLDQHINALDSVKKRLRQINKGQGDRRVSARRKKDDDDYTA